VTLQGYLARLADTLHSRHDITLEELHLMLTTVGAIFKANARFYDGSRLLIVEEVERVSSRDVRRVAYKFHYQQTDGTLVFRYDDSPHHPHLSTFPHHKHTGDSIIEAAVPDLADVLREIDALIYVSPDG
jgi:hypothetical protein